MKKSINYLNLINFFIRFFILGTIFLVPLIFDAFSFLDSVFTYPKVFIFYTFVFSLLCFTAIKLIYLKRVEINLRFLKYLLWPSILILFLIIITFFSYDFTQAFWGSYTRQFGLLTYLFLYLWFILLVFNLSLKDKVLKIKEIYISIAGSVFLISIYAILQYFGFDFITWQEPALITKRSFSTLGQPNYLSLFLVLSLPVVFYLFKIERKRYLKYFYLFNSLFIVFACFLTGSRSAWLALIAMLVIWFVYLIYYNKKLFNLKTIIISTFVFLIIFLGLFSQAYIRQRLESSFDFNQGSVAMRLLYWQAAYDKIVEKPIFGYGLEQQKRVLRDAYHSDWAIYEKLNTYSDRAHNIVLDYLLIGGLSLLVIFIFLIRSWFCLAFQELRKQNYEVSILILALAPYLVALLFSFEIISTSLYFWLFGALIITGSINKESEFNFKVLNLNFSSSLRFILIISLLIIFILFSYLQLQKLIANHYFMMSKQKISQGIYNQALLLYNYSQEINYSHKHYDLYFADSSSFLLIDNRQRPYRELELKLEDIYSSLSLNTYDNFLVKGRIQSALGNYDQAENDYFRAINLAPSILKTYVALADNYFLESQFEKALYNYNIAIAGVPDLDDFRINDEHRQQLEKYLSVIWEKKGDVYYKQGRYDKAIEAFQKAYNYNLYQIPILKKIADSYYFKDDLDSAIWYNNKGKDRNPSDPAWPSALSWLYFQKGEKEQAKQELEEALLIKADYKPALDLKKEFNFK